MRRISIDGMDDKAKTILNWNPQINLLDYISKIIGK